MPRHAVPVAEITITVKGEHLTYRPVHRGAILCRLVIIQPVERQRHVRVKPCAVEIIIIAAAVFAIPYQPVIIQPVVVQPPAQVKSSARPDINAAAVYVRRAVVLCNIKMQLAKHRVKRFQMDIISPATVHRHSVRLIIAMVQGQQI